MPWTVFASEMSTMNMAQMHCYAVPFCWHRLVNEKESKAKFQLSIFDLVKLRSPKPLKCTQWSTPGCSQVSISETPSRELTGHNFVVSARSMHQVIPDALRFQPTCSTKTDGMRQNDPSESLPHQAWIRRVSDISDIQSFCETHEV